MKMNIIRMLPFLEDAELKELVNSILNNEVSEEGLSVHAILPFLEKAEINQLFNAALLGTINDNPVGFLPFLEEDQINELVEKIQKDDEVRISLESVMPFMESDQIIKLFHQTLDSIKKKSE